MKINNCIAFCLALVLSCAAQAQPQKISSLPDSIYKVYKKLMKKWDKKVHFRQDQKLIMEELLVLKWNATKETEARLYPDTKSIYKEVRPANYRFWDNVKDMMTARQWALFSLYMDRYQEKKLRKNGGRDLSYYELWRF